MESGTVVIEKAPCCLFSQNSNIEGAWSAILASLIIVTDPPTAFFDRADYQQKLSSLHWAASAYFVAIDNLLWCIRSPQTANFA